MIICVCVLLLCVRACARACVCVRACACVTVGLFPLLQLRELRIVADTAAKRSFGALPIRRNPPASKS